MVNGISKYIDFTLLKTDASVEMFKKLCEEAKDYGFYSVCIPPYTVKECKRFLENSGVKITTVIGFPAGYASTASKVFEIKKAVEDGADEIDAVMNVSAFKSGKFGYVLSELAELRKAADKQILKIIIETCFLTGEEIIKASKLVCESGADFVKTSTGFGAGGAKLEDIGLIKKSVPENVKIKASGGIKTYEQAESFLKAGASRIGTSSVLIKNDTVRRP
ncbi:MAG: deoxyribose-phosphate aldolase [Endomicrobia bacterium]|nr:deoxyribose-phosphate aldolase [Endomicrobiia bacterium]